VHAVRPDVDVIAVIQAASHEPFPLGLPLGGQAGHHRSRQTSGRAEERFQRGHEVAGGQAMQIQQRKHLADLGALAAPGRQDRAGEAGLLAGDRVQPAVVDPGRGHRDGSCPSGNGAFPGMAVAPHQPVTALVPLLHIGLDIGRHLGLQGRGEHAPSALKDQLVEIQHELRPCLLVNHYTQHCGVTLLAGVGAPALPACRSSRRVRRALMQRADPQLQVIPQKK
jgi:hypothetical protein